MRAVERGLGRNNARVLPRKLFLNVFFINTTCAKGIFINAFFFHLVGVKRVYISLGIYLFVLFLAYISASGIFPLSLLKLTFTCDILVLMCII